MPTIAAAARMPTMGALACRRDGNEDESRGEDCGDALHDAAICCR
jgi:hypothetical protein